MTLRFYNTLTRKKEEFVPEDAKNVRMYVCGPTVYARPHLGNARSVVVYDVLYRLLRHVYGEKHVTYVRNITDVDDKINAAAVERGISIQALTQEVTQWFHDDMDALNVLRPTKEPKATEHIVQMIAMIEKLIANGNAYVAEEHVLFAVKTDTDYGKLSGRVQEDLKAGARVEVESYKRDAGDFVLWKPAGDKDDASSVFDSPWGKGRPGWHIECSAMSTEYLGTNFDLHGGGSDLMFPHHENEIAQSECANPKSTFAKYWVHNGFLTVNGEKMSKSLGNFITVKDLLDKGVKGEVIRYALLKTKYNEPLDWNEKLLEDADKAITSFYRVMTEYGKWAQADKDADTGFGEKINQVTSHFCKILADDLNTPLYVASLHDLVSKFHKAKSVQDKIGIALALGEAAKIIGVFDSKTFFDSLYEQHIDDSVHDLIQARVSAKKQKNWAEADRIRKELAEQGIILEDRPDGTTDWRRA